MSYISIPDRPQVTALPPSASSPAGVPSPVPGLPVPSPSHILSQKRYVSDLLNLGLGTSSRSCCGMCLRAVEEAIAANNTRMSESIKILKEERRREKASKNFNEEDIREEIEELRSKLKMYDSEYASLQELDEDISSADADVDGELGSAHKRLNDIHLNSERFKVLIEEILQKNSLASSLVNSLRSYSVISKMYSIKFPPSSPPSINGLKLSTSPPTSSTLTSYLHRTSQPITWPEITAAWTEVCKLIKNISNLTNFHGSRFEILTGGSLGPSKVGTLPRGKRQMQWYDLGRREGSGNISVGLGLLVRYLSDFWAHAQSNCGGGSMFMPFVMGEDRIGGIRLSLCKGREDWEKVVEGIARNLEFMKNHATTFAVAGAKKA
ncbi:hypothetical protein TrST_g11786 [Triparma strigata]|uniref:Atg6 BARA domain-containing protein n=1 Tax=Triparma strigata TaxID=1606541 RepID=A0A9W7EHI3_9STRA|nr:hypothetical protein TrST_g11786 [Triparma strigata]